jgi:hypothetical protein
MLAMEEEEEEEGGEGKSTINKGKRYHPKMSSSEKTSD